MIEQTDRRHVFTIGHSNHDEPTFLALLQQHRIDVVADVRSQPYSKYTTHFNADQIKPMLAAGRINYVFLGQELGAARRSGLLRRRGPRTVRPRGRSRRCSCRASSGWRRASSIIVWP